MKQTEGWGFITAWTSL